MGAVLQVQPHHSWEHVQERRRSRYEWYRVSFKPVPGVIAVVYLDMRAVPVCTSSVLGPLIPSVGQELLRRARGLIWAKRFTWAEVNAWIPATSIAKSLTGAGAFQVEILASPEDPPGSSCYIWTDLDLLLHWSISFGLSPALLGGFCSRIN